MAMQRPYLLVSATKPISTPHSLQLSGEVVGNAMAQHPDPEGHSMCLCARDHAFVNPISQVRSVAMLVECPTRLEAARAILDAIESFFGDTRTWTPYRGGCSSTNEAIPALHDALPGKNGGWSP